MDAAPSLDTPGHANLARAAALASVVALIGLGLAWELWLAPIGQCTLAVKVVPLALALRGLLRDRVRTYRWLSLLVWAYVAEGVVRAYGDHGASAVLAALEIALGLALFCGCLWRVRTEAGR